MQPTATSSSVWGQWWKLGGVFGILLILMFVSILVLQGDSPMRDDSVEEVRQYFTDNDTEYLIGDYLGGIAFVMLFVPFLATLTAVLAAAEGNPPIFSRVSAAGGILFIALGALSALALGTLAIGAAQNPEVDDSSVRTLMEMSAYAFTLQGFAVALFVGAASLVMVRTGVIWRWLGAIGLLIALSQLIGAAWPIDGDEEGALAIVGFVGFAFMGLWILASSIALLLRKEPPVGPA